MHKRGPAVLGVSSVFILLSGACLLVMATTAESASEKVRDDALSGKPKRPKKTVYLIRHAESEENEALGSLKSAAKSFGQFSLPSYDDIKTSSRLVRFMSLVDSSVSPKGKQQIEHMGKVLENSNFVESSGIELVLHSPLERARDTCLGMLQCLSPDIIAHNVKRVEECDLLSEKTPKEWIPGYLGAFKSRIASFEAWLDEQPEETVAIVGHSQYFKAMLNLDFKFGNCEVWKVEFDPSRSDATSESDNNSCAYELPPQWRGLTQLHKCDVAEGQADEPIGTEAG